MIRESDFSPAWWLPGAHLQTIWATYFRRRPVVRLRRERMELPDGDFVDLDWTQTRAGPSVLVLHGLEGGLRSHYAAGILDSLQKAGFNACLMYFRGCSGEPNRLPRSYHSGDTADLQFVVDRLNAREPLFAIVGYSLGGNVLLKWLGERGAEAGIDKAVAVSVPFSLDEATRRLDQGVSRVYQRHLLGKLRRSYRRKFAVMSNPLGSLDVDRLTTFRAFDDRVTAPLHGFSGVDDYYRRASSRPYLHKIEVPTLLLHARDDPFMLPSTVPAAYELSPAVTLELSDRGGHVGFIGGPLPWRPVFWVDQRILLFLAQDE